MRLEIQWQWQCCCVTIEVIVDVVVVVCLVQVSKRLEKTARYFKRLGSLGFWGQLVCTVVAAVILSFSVVITGKVTSPATFYATAGGIAAAFISVFWSFGYIRLSEKLRRTANEPTKVLFHSTHFLMCISSVNCLVI